MPQFTHRAPEHHLESVKRPTGVPPVCIFRKRIIHFIPYVLYNITLRVRADGVRVGRTNGSRSWGLYGQVGRPWASSPTQDGVQAHDV